MSKGDTNHLSREALSRKDASLGQIARDREKQAKTRRERTINFDNGRHKNTSESAQRLSEIMFKSGSVDRRAR
jgi:hypothetical protein